MAQGIKISERTSTILSPEPAMTDVLCIVMSLAVLGMIVGGHQTGYTEVGRSIASQFSVGAVMSVISEFFGLVKVSILTMVFQPDYLMQIEL